MFAKRASGFAAAAASAFSRSKQQATVHAIVREISTKQRQTCVRHLRTALSISATQHQQAMDAEFEPFPHFATSAVHAGQEPEQWNSRAVIPPISMSTTFKQFEPAKFAVRKNDQPHCLFTESMSIKIMMCL